MADGAQIDEVSTVSGKVPTHVAIIMDGNGRWAEARGQARHAGHRAGVAQRHHRGVHPARREGPHAVRVQQRELAAAQGQVGMLMELLSALQREVKRMQSNDIRLRVVGDVSAFPEKLQKRIRASEDATRDNRRLLLQIAANYGGRWDMTQAARRLAQAVRDGDLEPEAIDETAVAGALSMAGVPDPDLFIRTGGDLRISNFLLWQCAYTELYFTPVLWPDFDAAQFRLAIEEYARRQRRFGQTGAQVEGRP